MEILLPEPQHCVHMCFVFNGQFQSSMKREGREGRGREGEGRRRKKKRGGRRKRRRMVREKDNPSMYHTH